jgi:hypothetical protein
LVVRKYDVRKGVSIVSVLLGGHVRKFSVIYSGGPGVFVLFCKCPDQLWGPPCLLLNGCWGWGSWGAYLTTHPPHLVPSLKMMELFLYCPYIFMACTRAAVLLSCQKV